MSVIKKFLQAQRARHRLWLTIFLAVLAALAGANIFLRPAEPHFGYDSLPFFWPVFGLGVGLVMVFAMKKIVQPLIIRKEDYYDDL